MRQVAVEVGERLVAFTQGDAYEGSFIEGELTVLDAALDHLLGDTDTSLFLGAEQLTNLSFCLGAYDDGEPAGFGGLLRRGEDLYIISILELIAQGDVLPVDLSRYRTSSYSAMDGEGKVK